MTSQPGAPPLPPPLPPAVAARAVSKTARAVAGAWAQPMDPVQFGRTLSQLFSALRDLGIATRGLARYQTAGHPADPAPQGFPQLIETSAQLLLNTDLSLDGVLAAEGLGPVPVPDEPGAMLCQAVRRAITAWRQPVGTSAERDATVAQLITAVEFLAAATRSLTDHAPRHRVIGLHAVAGALTEITECLSEAIQPSQRTGEQE